jgi:hypothetical protein
VERLLCRRHRLQRVSPAQQQAHRRTRGCACRADLVRDQTEDADSREDRDWGEEHVERKGEAAGLKRDHNSLMAPNQADQVHRAHNNESDGEGEMCTEAADVGTVIAGTDARTGPAAVCRRRGWEENSVRHLK